MVFISRLLDQANSETFVARFSILIVPPPTAKMSKRYLIFLEVDISRYFFPRQRFDSRSHVG
jgi:hypothetical protein